MSKLKKYRFSGAVLLSGVLWGVIGLFVRRLDAMGFEFVTVTELIGEENLVAGETYYCAP